jgi:hypothetical protein
MLQASEMPNRAAMMNPTRKSRLTVLPTMRMIQPSVWKRHKALQPPCVKQSPQPVMSQNAGDLTVTTQMSMIIRKQVRHKRSFVFSR